MSMGAVIAYFERQTFNDALVFLEIANNLEESKTFERWRYFMWTIIAAQTFAEAYLKSFVLSKLSAQALEIFNDTHPTFKILLSRYIKKVLKLTIENGDSDWKDVTDILELRNKIMHHQLPDATFDSLTPDNAQKAIRACRTLVKRLHQADGTSCPTWIDNQTPEQYDK